MDPGICCRQVRCTATLTQKTMLRARLAQCTYQLFVPLHVLKLWRRHTDGGIDKLGS